ncbi:MAG: NAD-dependent succinate-semialdehyde dehydrogenase [Pseudomonadota bacterium]
MNKHMTNRFEYNLFIGGEWCTSGQPRIEVLNPADGSVVGSVANAGTEEALAAVRAANDAGPAWAATPPRERSVILQRCFELMQSEAEDLARLITLENGKSLTDARGEVAYAAEFFRWFAEEAVRIRGEMNVAPSGANRMIIHHQPVCVALLITPWNFPAAMATRKMGPALAAGCTVVLKPATETPLTAYAVADIMDRAGVPKGIVNVITPKKPSGVMSTLMNHPKVRKVSFTGSTQVGRILLSQAAQHVLKCSMELGGNAPFLVFEDADLEAAVDGAMIAKMRNGGEACTAANRFLVQESVADKFTEMLAEKMAALKVGNGLDDGVQCGPMINETAIEDIQALVDDAVGEGARVVTGGQAMDGDGHFFAPTVLADVPESARLLLEEIFGPVAPIVTFKTEEEAIQMANDTEYGLVSYLYTTDLARGLRVSEALDAGMIALNRGLVSDPAAPFGGTKQSGLGREGSHYGMHEFMEVKYIATDW